MVTIRQDDFVDSIANAFQHISVSPPLDFIQAMSKAWAEEKSPAAKDAIGQILTNARLCAENRRPICQDTGIAVVFLKIGMQLQWDTQLSVQEMVDEGVRRAYTHPDNPLRASVLKDPAGGRCNSRDNTPAVVHVEMVSGEGLEIICAAKGGGSENKAKLAMLNPSDSIVDWVLRTLPTLGAGWCPPGVLGLGIGGTPEKALLLAKKALMAPIDMAELQAKAKTTAALTSIETLRLELYDKINALGIGAQGLGGLTTILDVKILDYPTHAASLPVALIPNCAATRHVHFSLDGTGPVRFNPLKPEDYPPIAWVPDSGEARRVMLDTLDRAEMATWRPGEKLLLTGKLLTGRDAAHQRIVDLLVQGKPLPVDFRNRIIYYVGPVDPVRGEAVGPAGPTTATRMDKFTRPMLEQTGLLAMIGKAERGPEAIAAIKDHQSAYLIAVGGAAYLVAQAIKHARVVAFPDLGMEAIYEFDVVDMPVTVAVDSQGVSLHETGPKEWRLRIDQIRRQSR